METKRSATAVADAGFDVLVSTATDTPLDVEDHPRIRRRTGALTRDGMIDLIKREGIRAIVDAGHPYAAELHASAESAARIAGIPYYRLARAGGVTESESIRLCSDHEAAARAAVAVGRPILLTVGSKNLAPYVAAARKAGVAVAARVLSSPASIAAAVEAGLEEDHIIAGRGPFSVDENLAALRRYDAGVLVTKDGGPEGGVPEKLEAARRAGCVVVVVTRPPEPASNVYNDIAELVRALIRDG